MFSLIAWDGKTHTQMLVSSSTSSVAKPRLNGRITQRTNQAGRVCWTLKGAEVRTPFCHCASKVAVTHKSGQFTGESLKVTRAAVLIFIGNIISRALGLVRDMAKSYFFGAGGAVSAFDVAAQVPTMFYDQFVGGLLNSALVPVFSDYAHDEDRAELWQVLGFVFPSSRWRSACWCPVEIAAPWAASVLAKAIPVSRSRRDDDHITAPAVSFSHGRIVLRCCTPTTFLLPAFTAAVFCATVVAVILVGHKTLGASIGGGLALLASHRCSSSGLAYGARGCDSDCLSPYIRH